VFFKFTNIANGNAEIRRMRSAFDPNDPSLQVRLDNQKNSERISGYKTFCAGIGHAGSKAQRYCQMHFFLISPQIAGML
jgi:hypothetical protein